jgi:hypothetical protein
MDYTTMLFRSEVVMKLRSLLVLILFAAACRQHQQAAAASQPAPSSDPMPEMAGMEHSTQPVPGRNAPVLTAAQLKSRVAIRVYAEAAQVTDRLAKMYCYCQCHEERGHVSLLTCFQTDHAEICGICMREGDQVYRDWKAGLPVHASQHAADVAFHRGSPPPSLPQ